MANFATSITFGILKITAFLEVIAAATIALNLAPLSTLTSTLLSYLSPPYESPSVS